MKSFWLKISKNFEKYSLPRLSVYSIALSGVFLGLLTAVKFLDKMMPTFPSGIPVWEIYWTVAVLCAIVLPIAPAMLVLILAPIMWLQLGLTSFLNPVTFLTDYTIPTFVTIIVKLGAILKIDKKVSTNQFVERYIPNEKVRRVMSFNIASLEMWAVCFLVFVAAIMKWISHSIGGKLYWAPEAPWSYSFAFNAPFSFVNAAVSVLFIIVIYKPLIFIKDVAVLKEANRW